MNLTQTHKIYLRKEQLKSLQDHLLLLSSSERRVYLEDLNIVLFEKRKTLSYNTFREFVEKLDFSL